ncbi:MAG: SOS regulatory protein LexA [Candidatus Paceibacteria bacterium]|jgi:repressor LexA
MMFEEKVDKFKNFYLTKKRLPSYAEMMKLLRYKSKGGVTRFVEKMIEKGFVGKDKGKLYPINLKPKINIIGSISAGFPSMGEEVFNQSISLDEWIVRDPNATYMLQVEGDSMINAGIHKADYVVVEMTKDFTSGMIVVAEIDGEWTLKYLRTKKGKQYLEPANENYPDMYPEEELKLHAKVVGVVRKYD